MSIVLRAADHCIYCGESKEKLTLEHIIPHGMNGSIKLPKAVCASCQEFVNRVEHPLLARFYGHLRARLAYKSRTGLEKQKFPFEFTYPNGETETVYVKSKFVPLMAIVPSYQPPPILALKRINHEQGRLELYMEDQDEVKEFIRRTRPYAKSVTIPPVVPIALDALFLKMAVGLFFDVSPESLINSEICSYFLKIGDGQTDQADLSVAIRRKFGPFSIPREAGSHRSFRSHADCIEICDAGERYSYARMQVFPEVFKHQYFVRIPSIRNGQLVQVEYLKERLQSFNGYDCAY